MSTIDEQLWAMITGKPVDLENKSQEELKELADRLNELSTD